MNEYWEVNEERGIRAKDRQLFHDAIEKFNGIIIGETQTSNLSFDARIELPAGKKKEFEEFTKFTLTEPEYAGGNQ
jgi:hypothetical protein